MTQTSGKQWNVLISKEINGMKFSFRHACILAKITKEVYSLGTEKTSLSMEGGVFTFIKNWIIG